MAQFTNQARLSYHDTVVDSNIAIGEIREVLTASKSTINDAYRAGDRVTYVISIVNAGSTGADRRNSLRQPRCIHLRRVDAVPADL